MTSKELKVGDWVYYMCRPSIILSMSKTKCSVENGFDINSSAYKNVAPIPIVGVTLENNGWKHHIDYGRHYYTKGNIDLCSINVDGGFQFVCNHQTIKHVSYVHELQNLLWALGLDDELKI